MAPSIWITLGHYLFSRSSWLVFSHETTKIILRGRILGWNSSMVFLYLMWLLMSTSTAYLELRLSVSCNLGLSRHFFVVFHKKGQSLTVLPFSCFYVWVFDIKGPWVEVYISNRSLYLCYNDSNDTWHAQFGSQLHLLHVSESTLLLCILLVYSAIFVHEEIQILQWHRIQKYYLLNYQFNGACLAIV